MSQDRAEIIARQEVAAVLNKARAIAYQARPDSDQFVFGWVGPDDMDTTEICDSVKEAIEDEGGAVTLKKLQEILRREARQYEYGTPERIDEFVPHYQCRHTLMQLELEDVKEASGPVVVEVDKGRVYIDSPDEAPDNVEVQEGEQGGLYYETDTGSSNDAGDEYSGSVNLDGMDREQQSEVKQLIEGAAEKGWMSNVTGVTTEPEAEVSSSAVAAYNPFSEELYINPDKFDEETLAKGEESGWLVSGTKDGMFAHEIGHARHREEAKDSLFDIDGGTVVTLDDDEKEMLEANVSKTAAENLSEAVAEIHAGLATDKEFSDEVLEFYNQFDGPEVNNE
jgi:hypothetical protein